MISQLVGKREVKFEDKVTGKEIAYAELYCLVDDEHVEGKRTLLARVSLAKAKPLKVQTDYHFDYAPNAQGKAQLVGIYEISK